MAFAAADPRLFYLSLGLAAMRRNSDDPAQKRERAFDMPFKGQVWAGVGQKDIRDRAGETQVPAPALRRRIVCQQATFFFFATAIIIAVEITAFLPGWGAHLMI